MTSAGNPQTGKDSSSSISGLLHQGRLIASSTSTGRTAMTCRVKVAVFGNISASEMAKQWLRLDFSGGLKLRRPANSVADETV
jgi:hypothetical protein